VTPTIIFGPPGTGKTTKLLELMERAFEQGYEPEEIAFVSFTKAAVIEATARAVKKFGFPAKRLALFRTLHWVRCLPPYALEGMDERTFWQLLTLEFTAVMQLFPKPFLTRPTTALWFSAEQLLEPYPTDQAA
jgi:DNA polymerase III delta prime subunit